MERFVYLDYNASTPIAPEVADEMRPFLEGFYGNPSSGHRYGLVARDLLEKARKRVASLIHAEVDEIIFTSGGTESNNMAIYGAALANKERGKHLITTNIEHPSVLEVFRYLETQGFSVTYLPVDSTGRVDPQSVEDAIRADTILVSVMHANNETGAVQPVEKITAICRKHGILVHCDAAQSAGKIPVDVTALGIDLMSLAGHKLYGPKGIGALFIRRGIHIEKILRGADHEQNLRPGTENTMQIAGFGKACEIAARDLQENMKHYREMAEKLWSGLHKALPDIRRNGLPGPLLPNTLNISFPGIEANVLVSELDELAVSAGAACHTEDITVSHVLEAMKIPVLYAMGTLRISTGRETKAEDVDFAIDRIVSTVKKLKGSTDSSGSTQEQEVVRLTRFTSGLGCACKLRPQVLEKVLQELPVPVDPNILVGRETSDDAAVYRIDDEHALVTTVDFFTPIVDDPWWFGAIAAANALSDIYAMGGTPLFGLNIVGFPSNRLPLEVLEKILKGAEEKCREAGIPVLGGHTIDDNEPKFGMSVSGIIHPGKIIKNRGVKPGDHLILTKPIGTGILATGIKKQVVSPFSAEKVMQEMARLNDRAAKVILEHQVHACTDITGFGLLGHLGEMLRDSGCSANIDSGKVPVFDGVKELIVKNIIPGGTKNNMDFTSAITRYPDNLAPWMKILLNDAQTSGGLLAAIPERETGTCMKQLLDQGINASDIGTIEPENTEIIRIY